MAEKSEPGRVRAFLRKHRGKIAAGVALAATIGAAVGLYYHGKKVRLAVEQAGIEAEYRATAITIVGLLGTIGPERTLKFFRWATTTNIPFLNEKVVSDKEFFSLVSAGIGNALAYYFYPDSGASRIAFRAKFVAIVPQMYTDAAKATIKEAASEVRNAASKISTNIKVWLKS